MIPGCGHGMMEEKPEQTHKALVAALDGMSNYNTGGFTVKF